MGKLLKQLQKKEIILTCICVGFICIQVYLDLLLPDYMSTMTTLLQAQGNSFQSIFNIGFKMVICSLGSLLSSVLVAVIASRIATRFGGRIREKLFDQVQAFSLSEINHFSTASLITRSTNDVTQVQNLIVMGLQVVIKAPIMAIWAILKIADKNWQWTAATAIAVVILLVVNAICIIFALPKFNKVQGLTDDVNRIARENLTGLSVVRAYNAESYQEEKFEKANQELTQTNLFANSVLAILNPSIQMIMNGLTLAVYWIGAALINEAGMMDKAGLFSDMIVFSTYAMQVVMSFMLLVMIFIMLPRSLVSARRINEVLDTPLTIFDGNVTDTQSQKGEIEFKNVSFQYPDAEQYVLKNVSFQAHQGQTIAFIGSTGSGKSTLINLIPRFYDVTEGEILIDGINVKDYNQKTLRNKIGYVSQKAVLFQGTIRSNVDYGDNGKKHTLKSDIIEAIYTAKANEFVETDEVGYDGYVAQNGSNFSGGQKQRLSIARAICRHPEIFIFDDSFSALDYKTDKELRRALNQDCQGTTKLIVAQRIGTIMDADQIIVLNEGEVVGQGTHQELMKTCQVYQEIAYSQLSKEELENE